MKAILSIVICAIAVYAFLKVAVPDFEFPWQRQERVEQEKRIEEEKQVEKARLSDEQSKREQEKKRIEAEAVRKEAVRRAQLTAEASRDSELFSSRISTLTTTVLKDPKATKVDVLSAQLADPEVNRLARKYLKHDFALIRADLLSRVREAARQKDAFEKALAKNEEEFKAAIDVVGQSKKLKMNTTRREYEEIGKRIVELEKERSSLDRRLVSGTERVTINRRIAANNAELEQLRRRQLQMRSVGSQNTLDERAEFAARTMRQERERTKRENEMQIRRTLTPKLDAFAVAEEIEQKTVKELEHVITAKCSGL